MSVRKDGERIQNGKQSIRLEPRTPTCDIQVRRIVCMGHKWANRKSRRKNRTQGESM